MSGAAAGQPALDVAGLSGRYRSGELRPSQAVELAYRRIAAWPDVAVWISLVPQEEALERARDLEARAAADPAARSALPLYGIPFAVKDNIDVAGLPTTAGCPAFARTADASAEAVRRLLAAGAILVGKTNMDQFASGLVGVRSPYGEVANPFDPRYIAGGSSSGSAVAVAAGMVSFALGTDTAGSGRVPAAFANIAGLKPTRGLVSCAGVVPACRSLDCVSVFAPTSGDARAVLAAMAGFDPGDPFARPGRTSPSAKPGAGRRFRFGVPSGSELRFFGDAEAERLYASALAALERLGGERVEVEYAPFREAAALLYGGPFVAERLEAPGEILADRPESLHPVVRGILEAARGHTALDLFRAQAALRTLRRKAEREWRRMDLLALPTTPTIYTRAAVRAEPLQLNANLGYYTNFVNLLDSCALALPCGFRADGLPAGITLVAEALEDDFLCDLGARFEAALGIAPGIAARTLPVAGGSGAAASNRPGAVIRHAN